MPHGGMRALAKHLVQNRLDECRSPLEIMCCQSMIDSFGNEAMVFEPGACPLMENGEQVRMCLGEAKAQRLCKEMVVAVPGALIVQRQQEEVGLLEPFQCGLPVALPGHGITEGPVQTVAQGSLQQERADMLSLLAEHFFRQVIHDVAMTASKGGDKPGDILSPLHREGRQLQSSNPALR